MGRNLVVPSSLDWIWPDEVVCMSGWSSRPSLQPYKNIWVFIHHDENLPELYSGGFSKSFGLELTTFSGIFKQNYTTFNYTLYYITLHNIMFIHDITQKEGKVSLKMRQCFKIFWGRYCRNIVTHLKKSLKIF